MINKEIADILDELIGIYESEYEILSMQYRYMGLMLNDEYLTKRITYFNMKKAYIYGADYLGIQLYRGLQGKVSVPAMIDKKGTSACHVPKTYTIDLETFKRTYDDGFVIITPVRFFDEIHSSIDDCVADEQILFLGEFMGDFL